jgi:hypothetical protein
MLDTSFFAQEMTNIYLATIGVTAKEYKESNGVSNVLDNLSYSDLFRVVEAILYNCDLIKLGYHSEYRTVALRRHNDSIII